MKVLGLSKKYLENIPQKLCNFIYKFAKQQLIIDHNSMEDIFKMSKQFQVVIDKKKEKIFQLLNFGIIIKHSPNTN